MKIETTEPTVLIHLTSANEIKAMVETLNRCLHNFNIVYPDRTTADSFAELRNKLIDFQRNNV